jgi:hypothetical protein
MEDDHRTYEEARLLLSLLYPDLRCMRSKLYPSTVAMPEEALLVHLMNPAYGMRYLWSEGESETTYCITAPIKVVQEIVGFLKRRGIRTRGPLRVERGSLRERQEGEAYRVTFIGGSARDPLPECIRVLYWNWVTELDAESMLVLEDREREQVYSFLQ